MVAAASICGLLSGSFRNNETEFALQLSLLSEFQTRLQFELRLHGSSTLHYDFRIRIGNTLFSTVVLDPLWNAPEKWSRLKLVGDHNPAFMAHDRVIAPGRYGAGPTVTVDIGECIPIVCLSNSYAVAAVQQLLEGDFRFTLRGKYLRGGWKMVRVGREIFKLQKLHDEHVTSEMIAPDRSITSGKSLDEFHRDWIESGERAKLRRLNSGQLSLFPTD